MPALEAALATRDLEAAMQAVPWDELGSLKFDLTSDLESVLVKSAQAAAAAPTWAELHLPMFNLTNPEALSWVKGHAADLVKYIDDSSQAAIRDLVRRAFDEGIPVKRLAPMVRQHIGLLPKHAAAVEKYRQVRIAKVGEAKAQIGADAYARKLLNYRAKLIARNECMVASSQGQYTLWTQARAEGYLPDDQFERKWLTTPDDRACTELCVPMHYKRAPINGTWRAPNGKVCAIPQDIHPGCRCSSGIARKEKSTETWIPSDDVKAAESWAQSAGVKTANYGGDPRIGNASNQVLSELKNRNLPLPKNIVSDASVFDAYGDKAQSITAIYDPDGKRVIFNPKATYWENPGSAVRVQHEAGFWSTDDPLHAVRHEFGHAAHHTTSPDLYEKLTENRSRFKKLVEMEGASVSRYSQREALEFEAEVFSGSLAGKVYPQSVMDLYSKLGGAGL